MTDQLRHKNSASDDEASLPAEFIAVCVLAFVAGVSATAYFCRSMCCEMEMPGGWTISMMWMRMPGQNWFASATNFLLMWLAMMVAMMLPSALPTFLKTRRAAAALSLMAIGYFAVWLVSGVGIYALGVAFAAAAMRWENFSRICEAVTFQQRQGLLSGPSRRFGLEPNAVHGDNRVIVFLLWACRGINVPHFRHRLTRRVVIRHRLEQRAPEFADWFLRHFRQLMSVTHHNKLLDTALQISLGVPGDFDPLLSLR